MATSRSLLFTALLLLAIDFGQSHNCNSLIVKESEGLLNYLANVTLVIPTDIEGDWTLDMETDVSYTFIGVRINFGYRFRLSLLFIYV